MAQPTAKTVPARSSATPTTFAWTAGTTSPTLLDWMPGDILLAKNTHATLAKTVTVVSNPKSKRTATTIAAFSIAAGIYVVFPRFPSQDDDTLSVTCESTDIQLARLSTKAQPV